MSEKDSKLCSSASQVNAIASIEKTENLFSSMPHRFLKGKNS